LPSRPVRGGKFARYETTTTNTSGRRPAALENAWTVITDNPSAGLPAPRPYPQLALPGRRWIKSGRYWILYRDTPPLVIVGVFFETSDIPSRL